MLLYAGGTTGLVLLTRSKPARRFCASLGESAEAFGLSALAFAAAIPGDPVLAADRAAALLESLGVEKMVLVAIGDDAVAALRAAASAAFAALVLIEPSIPEDELETLLGDVPMAKLLLVGETTRRRRLPPRPRTATRSARSSSSICRGRIRSPARQPP